MSDIKVGDLISILASDSPNWVCMRIPDEASLNEANAAIASGFTVKHGLHPSLIPEGFAIVPIEPNANMVKDAMKWFSAWSYMRLADKKNAVEDAYKAMIESAPKPTDK